MLAIVQHRVFDACCWVLRSDKNLYLKTPSILYARTTFRAQLGQCPNAVINSPDGIYKGGDHYDCDLRNTGKQRLFQTESLT